MKNLTNLTRWSVLMFFAVMSVTTVVRAQTNIARTGRFYRGSGTNTFFQSFVVPLDFQKGIALDNVNGNATNLFPVVNGTNYGFGTMRYHYDATNPSSSTNVALRIPFNNPIVAFGSRVGGSPLYFGQDYHFGAYAGITAPSDISNALYIVVYRASDMQLIQSVPIEVPQVSDTNAWRSFVTNGYQSTVTAYGLTTTLRFDDPYTMWGVNWGQGEFHLTHNATQTTTNYIYTIILRGYNSAVWLTTDTNGLQAWSRLYTLEFQQRPPWRAIFLDQPHFTGTPVPSFYLGKSLPELLTNAPPVTNAISLTPSACTNLDASPELRRHPTLDQFVTDMRGDPLALVNYVQNEIEITDALAYNDNGSVSDISINLGGVNRSALATFMEKQGSPTEQCALLIYLLRQAGVPAVYVFPPENGMKMLDTQLSKLLRMQIHGAINFNQGANNQPYTTNALIAVNYPWVAAYIGTNWVHLFPWLKDTEIVEGLNLYNYMPANYKTSYQWVKDYIYGKTNIMNLSTNDDTPETLFPLFVNQILATNSPGISIDDIGVQIVNRRHLYSRWGDFPRPPVVTNTSVAIESLGSPTITNVYSGLTNIFDTVSVTVSSVANPNTKIATGTLRMVDLHNRKFLIRHEKISSTQHRIIMSLEPYRTNVVGIGAFTNDSALLKQQSVTNTLGSSDDALTVQIVNKRHQSLPNGFTQPYSTVPYLGLTEGNSITNNRPLRKGDLAAICLNVGRVTPQMLQVHAQELWNMESTLRANLSATNTLSPDVYQGAVAYLMGMAYYEKDGRFDIFDQHLHKVQIESQSAYGLASIRAARTNNALPSGNIDLVQPSVDMFYQQVVIAGNSTLHLDSGDDGNVPQDDYFHLFMANGSAQEHSVINQFFNQTDAVSTMKLLQLAQAKSATNGQPGVLILDYSNYQSEGNKNYPTTGTIKLKDQSTNIWTTITNAFTALSGPTYSSTENYVQVFITPGPVTNQSASFKGMAAFILEPSGAVAAIAEKNGGYGANNPAGSLDLGNSPNVSLSVDSDNNYSVNLTPPGSNNHTLAPDEYANYNSGNVANTASQDYYAYSSFQTTWTSDLLDMLGLTSQGSQNLNFSQSVQAANGNQAYLGWTTDALSQNGSGVADPVHMVTGEFYINAADLALPGPMPLVVNRNYSSLNLADNEFGYGWKLNYMPFLSVNANSNVLYAAEPDGAVIAYQQTATNANIYLPAPALNPQLNNARNAGIGSVANRLQNRVVQQAVGTNTFDYLYNPDGSKRTFQVMTFSGGTVNRTRPYLTQWQDSRGNFFTFSYGTDSTRSDFAECRRVQSSNGSFLGFYYDVYGHITEAYTGDGRRLEYEYDQYGDLISVTRPDQSVIQYQYNHQTQSVTNGSIVTVVPYSTHLVVKEIKPDGRTLKNDYDQQRRVTNQWSTVGQDLTLYRNATFVYSNNFNLTNSYTNTITGFTIIKDVFNNTNRYDYTNNLITKITDALNQTVIQNWYDDSETNKAGYYLRSLEYRTDQRGLVTQFQYDSSGNVTNTVISGDLTGDGTTQYATNTFAYNTNNLPISTVDPAGNRVDTVYDSQYTFLPALIIRYAGSTSISTNKLTYINATNTVVAGSTILTNMAFGLMQQQVRAYGSSDAASNVWVLDGRGFITQSVSYTGTSDPAITNNYLYNDRGELVEQADAAGRKTDFGFDPLGRPISREVFEANQTQPIFWDYSYFNDNGELVWSDGPRFNPEDYVWRDYDGGGRLITAIHWRSEAKTDGSGVQAPADTNLYTQTFYQYDLFGNLTRSVDPRGAITTNSWDVLGRLIQHRSLDLDGTTVLSSEGFAYEPGGLVHYHTNALGGVSETQYTTTSKPKFQSNADGSTNAWRYYADGRIRREIQGNGAYTDTIYDDANLKTTRTFYSASGSSLSTNVAVLDRRGNAFRRVDAGGNNFTNIFDGLDRLKTAVGPAIVTVNENCSIPNCGVYVTNVLQQATTNFYDFAGVSLTNINALGEKTIKFFDALGRTTRTEIRNAGGTLVQESSIAYSQDQNSITATNGSGSSGIVTTIYTDNNGRNLLSIAFPTANVREFTLNQYDLAGNLNFTERASATNGAVTQWKTASLTYDGLNRLKSKSDLDSALTTFGYDAGNNLTNRAMPGNLTWSATYNSANQPLTEKDSNGAQNTRNTSYSYYPVGNQWAGLLKTVTDGSGVTHTNAYDNYLRVASVTATGTLPEQQMSCSWQYEARGLLTSISQSFASTNTGPATSIQRSYNAYGQLTGGEGFGQGWDAAGRRTQGGGMSFQYRADGLMTAVNGATFGYGSNGLLTGRTNGSRTVTIDQRDGAGRPTQATTKNNLATVLTETWTWTGDGLPNNYIAARSDFTDTRRFTYGSQHRRLTQETLNLGSSQSVTNNYTFDNGVAAGLGVITKVAPQSSTPQWSGVLDSFSRVVTETNSFIHRTANGSVNGAATLRAYLNGQSLDVRYDPHTASSWMLDMPLASNTTNTLAVYADHPSGRFTTNHANTFTVSAGSFDKEDSQYDGAGNVTNRVWKNASGQVVKTQTLTWDAFGRLVKLTERDTSNNGFNLAAVFDGLGRQIQTTETTVSNNVALASNPAPAVVSYTYDPQVEFLIVGISISQGSGSRQDSLTYGPDIGGRYGGMQGVGGLETITTSPFNQTAIAVNDAFGNIIAAVTNGAMAWNSSRLNLYAPVEGYAPPRLSLSAPTYASLAWRTRSVTAAGFVQLGARPYDFGRRAFLSADPLGYDSDAALNTAFGGNPAAIFDPDGRVGLFQMMFPATAMAAGAAPWTGSVQGDLQYSRGAFAPFYVGAAVIQSPRVQGGFKVVGGTGEMVVGGTGFVATSPTVVGSIVSGAAVVHGADTFQSGIRQFWTGQNTPSFTEQGLTYITGSPTAGRIGDTTLGIGLSLGSGLLTQGSTQGGRVTQFYNPALGDFGPGANQALSSPLTLGSRLMDGAAGVQTWVAPGAAQDMNWLQRMLTGVGSSTKYVEFDAATSELSSPGGLKSLFSPWQQVMDGEIGLAGRNPVWGELGLNYGQYGFMSQLGPAGGREAAVILSKHN